MRATRGHSRVLAFVFAATLSLLAASGAMAATVTYTTEISFDSGAFASTAAVTSGGSKITFIGSSEDADINPGEISGVSFGEFRTESTTTGTSDSFDIAFSLRINQSSPTIGSSIFSGELSGLLRIRNSGIEVEFFNSQAKVAPVLYALNDDSFLLPKPPSTGFATKTVDGTASLIVPTPGAATAGLFLLSLAGLRRRPA